MRIKNSTPFSYGYARTSRRPPQPEMTLVVRGKFAIKPGQAVSVPEGIPPVVQGPVTGDVFADDDDDRAGECLYASDLAQFKPHAEVLLRGTCHVPGGAPLAECPVRFAVGGWSKILRVVGPRVWTEGVLGAKPTQPIPFTRMPLGYTNSFGGPEYAANPVGKGLGSLELPNVEGPGEPIHARSDRPTPAGYGPLSPGWPARQRKMQKARSASAAPGGTPFFGEDFDWTYFNAAPPDQQLRGYLRGDEEIAFQNLHPTHPVLEARLPGIRVRAFVKDKEGRFREVGMNLDTLFADMDAEAVFLTWRGLDAVKEIDLHDVATVLFASEPMSSAPLPAAHYREAMEAFERNPNRMDEVFSEQQLAEFGLGAPAPPAAPGGAPDPVAALVDEKLGGFDAPARARISQRLSGLLAAGAGHGVDLSAPLAAALDQARSASPSARPGSGQQGVLRAFQEKMGALQREANTGGSASTAALMNDPPAAGFVASPPRTTGETKLPVEPGPGCDLSGEDLSHRDLSGRDLRGAKLDRANLMGTNLQRAQLGGASLKQAILSETDLSGADLSDADLTGAFLTNLRAPGASFRRATLTRAVFHDADLTGADLSGAKGDSPIFSRANLREVNAKQARFFKVLSNKTILEGADFSGAELLQGTFAHASARGVNLSGATLTKTSFFGSDLSQATLVEARGEQTVWSEATLTEADFSYTVLPRAIFNEAKAVRTRFYCADLRQGRFYRTDLEQAELVRANLFEANLTLASVYGTRFIDANLYGAKLVMATGAECDFNGANLKGCVREIKNARG